MHGKFSCIFSFNSHCDWYLYQLFFPFSKHIFMLYIITPDWFFTSISKSFYVLFFKIFKRLSSTFYQHLRCFVALFLRLLDYFMSQHSYSKPDELLVINSNNNCRNNNESIHFIVLFLFFSSVLFCRFI